MSQYPEGTYYKVVGGDEGLFWDGRKWHSFECLGCEIARNHIVPARRLSTSTKLMTMLRNSIDRRLAKGHKRGFEFLHDCELHAQWFAAGKPYRKDSK